MLVCSITGIDRFLTGRPSSNNHTTLLILSNMAVVYRVGELTAKAVQSDLN